LEIVASNNLLISAARNLDKGRKISGAKGFQTAKSRSFRTASNPERGGGFARIATNPLKTGQIAGKP